MIDITFTDELQSYELQYWNAHKNIESNRSTIMSSLFTDTTIDGNVAADIGCGPHCGIFNELVFPTMYAVDPLWSKYNKSDLDRVVIGAECIESSAGDFVLPEKADVIFSFNALDHSGCLKDSFNNIMANLNDNGRFYFHMHLRTKGQLNAGHRMIITEDDIDSILSQYMVISKRVVDKCPLDNKYYRSYISIVSKGEI